MLSSNPGAASLLEANSITSLIMDAEVVAVDRDSGAFRTFQDLTARAKKDVKVEDVKVGVGVFAFDLMELNGVVSVFSFPCFCSAALPTGKTS
jgi:DNA ligase-1